MGHLNRLLRRPDVLRGAVLLLIAAFVWTLYLAVPGARTAFEERGGDVFWGLAAADADKVERRVVIVRIDEDSLARVGPWPWSRDQIARVANALHAEGARVQLYDVVFPEAREGDPALIQSIAALPLAIGQIFDMQPDGSRVGTLAGALPGATCAPSYPLAGGYVANHAALAAAAGARAAVGHITPALGSDGAVRHIAPVICHQQRAYPALALRGVGMLAGQPAEPGAFDPTYTQGTGWLAPAAWLRLPGLGLSVPLDADGTTRIPYDRNVAAFASVSVADLLEGRVPAGLLRGAIALVGATAFGIGDTVPTPLAANAAGVEVHARFLAGMLDESLVYTPRGAHYFQLGLMVLGAAVLIALGAGLRALPGYVLPALGLALGGAAYLVHGLLLLGSGLWVGWAAPALFFVLAGVALSALELARTRLERTRLFHNLSSYLPRQVAAQIALYEPRGTIEAERREISVLFADLRNFSAYCEARPPEEAAALLHAFFSSAYRVVTAHGGIVEEFVGDAVMAIWNAPQRCDDHPRRALEAAQALVAEINALLPAEAPPGLEPLALGVGLETGPALVGSFGAAERRTHAALGETVTVAVRLQAMSTDLLTDIVIGPVAAARLPDAGLVSVGSFLLEGLQRPRTLHVLPPSAQAAAPARPPIRLVA